MIWAAELPYSTQGRLCAAADRHIGGKIRHSAGTKPGGLPATDDKYTATLTSLQKKLWQAWEQPVNDRDWHIEENRRRTAGE